MIRLFSPYIPYGTLREIEKTLLSGQIAQGLKVDQFEKEFNNLFNTQYAVSVNSGTSALELAYDLVGLKEGDEVISTPLTCTATNLPLLRRGVRIIWADVLEDSLTIDPIDVRAKMTEVTKAVIQVHLGGVQADVGMIHLPVISDAAQALGIFTGEYTCCSFQAIKHITTGDGGMLVLSNEADYKRAKLLRWFGIDRERTQDPGWERYLTRMMTCEPQLAGYKYQMNDIQASMGILGLKHYREIIRHRHKLFNLYRSKLKDIDGIRLVDGKNNVYWLATLLVENRNDFAQMLYDAGIECNVVQIRNDLYEIFGGKRANLPVLEKIEHKYVSVPIGMHITEEDVDYVCTQIEKGWN